METTTKNSQIIIQGLPIFSGKENFENLLTFFARARSLFLLARSSPASIICQCVVF